jgi:2,4-dienoyl-CoA reductase-like NADH-dependent reductase (Old Yellow Enzyme family)
MIRKNWDGFLIGVGNLNPESASNAITDGLIDLSAFGRLLLANADFIQRIKEGKSINSYHPKIHLSNLY